MAIDGVQLDSASSVGPQIAAINDTTTGYYYALNRNVWGGDTSTFNDVDTGTPLPTQLFGNTDSTTGVFVFNSAGAPMFLAGDTAGTPVDDSNPLPVAVISTDTQVSLGTNPTVDLGANNDVVNTVSTPFFIAGDTAGTPVDDTNAFPVAVISTDTQVSLGTNPTVDLGANNDVVNTVSTPFFIAGDTSGTPIDDTNPFPVALISGTDTTANVIDSNNSSTDTLGAAGTFTGTGTDVSAYSSVSVMFHSDAPSSDSGMTFQFSTDNTNWDDVYRFTYGTSDTTAGKSRRFQFPVTGQYFRTVYTNGGAAQGQFRVQTILHKNVILPSIHRLGDTSLNEDRSVNVTKSAIVAQRGGTGNFIPVSASGNGNLKVDIEEAQNDSSTPLFVNNSSTHPLFLAGDTAGTAVDDTNPLPVTLKPEASGGLSFFKDDVVGDTAILVTGSAAQLYGYYFFNPDTATTAYVHLYNDTAVTLGTDTDALVFGIPPLGGANAEFTNGIAFGTGISVAVTTSGTDTAQDAPGTQVAVNLFYK